nr:3-oxoacyl-[acyl-carrier-protein] synthase I, chloroplastic [Tanacetum cinerariifolium]
MSSPITVRSSSRIITTRSLQIFASCSSATAPKRKKDAKKRVVITDVQINKERAGVLVGSVAGGSMVSYDGMEALIERGYARISPFLIPFTTTSMSSALLAMDLGFSGPNYAISAACPTSNTCFLAAANYIRDGNAELMIAGGVDACINPITMGGFAVCKALSRRNDDPLTACRPWDQDRDGFVMGEGAGVLVMESLEHAMKRDAPILAEYLGGAVNCDAYHITNPRSEGLSLFSCIQSGLVDAKISVEEIWLRYDRFICANYMEVSYGCCCQFLPYVGYVTIIMTDYPFIKYALIGAWDYSPLHPKLLVKKKAFREIDDVFVRMRNEGQFASCDVLSEVVRVYSQCGLVDKGLEFYKNVVEVYECVPNVYACNALLSGLVKCGRLESACEVYDEMVQRGGADNYSTCIM